MDSASSAEMNAVIATVPTEHPFDRIPALDPVGVRHLYFIADDHSAQIGIEREIVSSSDPRGKYDFVALHAVQKRPLVDIFIYVEDLLFLLRIDAEDRCGNDLRPTVFLAIVGDGGAKLVVSGASDYAGNGGDLCAELSRPLDEILPDRLLFRTDRYMGG